MKQVIVVRTHYPDEKGSTRKVRTGKLMAQVGHAVLGCFAREVLGFDELSPKEEKWFEGDQKKICCYVKTEEELLALKNAALEAEVRFYLVEDKGLTEFKEPTLTVIAIGPDEDEKIDSITGHLPLY